MKRNYMRIPTDFSEPGQICPGSLCRCPNVGILIGCVDKKFNIGHNLNTSRIMALKFYMCISRDNTFHIVPKVLTLYSHWLMNYVKK